MRTRQGHKRWWRDKWKIKNEKLKVKNIVLHVTLTDELKVKSITFNHNDTGLESGKDLLDKLSRALLQSIEMDRNNDDINELLNELKISRIKP